MLVTNMTSERTDRPVANQFIIYDDNKIIFQSYETTIAVVNGKKVEVNKDYYNYSQTTMKYFWRFVKSIDSDFKNEDKKYFVQNIDDNCKFYTSNFEYIPFSQGI